MKKISYFIPHLILVTLLVNKKMIDKRKMENHLDLRSVSSFPKKNNLSKEDPSQGLQIVESPKKDQPLLRADNKNCSLSVKDSQRGEESSYLDQKFFSDLKLPEDLKKKLTEFLLLTQKSVLLPGDFDSGVKKLKPHARDLIRELSSFMKILMSSEKHHWIVGPLINLVNQLEVPPLMKNDFYSKVVKFSRPEHFDSSQPSTAYGLQAIKQIANSNDFETIKTVFNSTVQKYGYNPQIFNELREIDQEYNLMVKLNFGLY